MAAASLLDTLITDVWTSRRNWLLRIPFAGARNWGGRFHSDLRQAKVRAFNSRFLAIDLVRRFRRCSDEAFFSRRNSDFDRLASRVFEQEFAANTSFQHRVVFAYAHACGELFRMAKKHGCTTVLGQFDPGPIEADIVDREHAENPQLQTGWARYSDRYVESWRTEVDRADRILVNSRWSKSCLEQVGIPSARIDVIPLVYSPPAMAGVERLYPSSFTPKRPLRVLFLGQVILRKGIARLLRAATMLQREPIDIRLVGPTDIGNLSEACEGLPIRYLGPASRSEVSRYYTEADVFILPTLSDGFAITQIEAQTWRLPVITTTRCGEVVRDGVNGIVLREPTGEAITHALRQLLERPGLLAEMSSRTRPEEFGIDSLARQLAQLTRRCNQLN